MDDFLQDPSIVMDGQKNRQTCVPVKEMDAFHGPLVKFHRLHTHVFLGKSWRDVGAFSTEILSDIPEDVGVLHGSSK